MLNFAIHLRLHRFIVVAILFGSHALLSRLPLRSLWPLSLSLSLAAPPYVPICISFHIFYGLFSHKQRIRIALSNNCVRENVLVGSFRFVVRVLSGHQNHPMKYNFYVIGITRSTSKILYDVYDVCITLFFFFLFDFK